MSKTFEQLVQRELLSCFGEKVIPDKQLGFLPGCSTVWQLLSPFDDWYRSLESGHSVHALFLDMSKAFNCVEHRCLLRKLVSIGISGPLLSWYESFLDGRSILTAV